MNFNELNFEKRSILKDRPFLFEIRNMFRAFVLIALTVLCGFSFAMKKPAFPLKEEIKGPLTFLLDEAVSLHRAVYSKQEKQIHVALLKMRYQIEMLEKFPQLLPYHQQSYIKRLLQYLKPKLEAIKAPGDNRRKNNIASINRTITYMAHVYGLKKKYAVFFCPQDRSVWMQKEKKARQTKPLHLEYRSCGALVGK